MILLLHKSTDMANNMFTVKIMFFSEDSSCGLIKNKPPHLYRIRYQDIVIIFNDFIPKITTRSLNTTSIELVCTR